MGCDFLLNTGATVQTKTGGINLATTSGNVGIGTSSPSYKLDVTGTARFTGALTGLSAIFSSTVAVGTPTGDTHAVTKGYVDAAITNASSKWTTSGTNTYLTTTTNNVGIGTISPAYKLDVNGALRVSSSAYFDAATFIKDHNSTIDSWWGWYAWDKEFQFNKRTSANAFVQNIFVANWDTGNFIIVPTSGSVGIGTTSPSYKLDVNGTARFTGAVIVPTPSTEFNPATKGYVDSTVSSGVTSGAVIAGSTSVGYLKYNGTTALAGALDGGTTSPSGTNRLNYGGYLYATQLYDGGTRVAISSRSITAGDGITGGGDLTANRSIAVNSTVIRTTGNQTLGGVKTFSSSPVVPTPTDGTYATNKSYVDTAISGAASKWTTSGTNTYLTATGNNVGIGTSAPSKKLHVVGDIGIDDNNLINFLRADGSSSGYMSSVNEGEGITIGENRGAYRTLIDTFNDSVTLSTGASGINKMILTSAGNVGINTASPSYKLDVNGTARFTGAVIVGAPSESTHAATKGYVDSTVSSGVTSGAVIAGSTSVGYLKYNGTTALAGALDGGTTSPSGTNRLNYGGYLYATRLYDGGTRVAISSRSITAGDGITGGGDLTANRSIAVNSTVIRTTGNQTLGGVKTFSSSPVVITPTDGTHATNKSYVDTAIASAASKWTTSGTNTYLTATGNNVGIGTTTPGAKLDVNGDIRESGTILSAKYAAISHKYHTFSNGQYYFDSYAQGNYLRLFTEIANFDLVRFQPISNVEYFNGSSWTSWSGGEENIKKILDGREETGFSLTNTYRQFRFTVSKSSGWPTTSLVVLQNSWTSNSYPGATVKIENWIDGAWVQKDVANFTSGHGINMKVVDGLHDGIILSRITIEFNQIVGVHEYISLRRFMILSNFNGGVIHPWNWDYDRRVIFPGSITSQGSAASSFVGSVGIGTTSPGYKLDVNGTARFTSTVSVGTPTSSNHATTKSYVDDLVTGASSKWTTSGTNTYLTTTTNNVGIGTTTPGVKLHVNGLSTFNSSGRFATNGLGFYFGNDSVAYRNPAQNIPAMVIRMDEANAGLKETKAGLVLYNANGGQNTGAGIAFASRETITGGNDVALSGIFGIKESEGTSGAWSQGGLRFWTKNYGSIIEALSIRYDGNVGINTTSPAYKLDVNGTARFTGAVIVGAPSESTHAATKGYVDSTVSSGVTSGAVIAGSTSVGYLKYNGTTALAGALDGGTTAPSGTNRLNYGGYLYATQLYDGGTRVAISSRSITAGDGITGGGDLTANRSIAVNSTVIRTTGNQTLGGIKTFSSSPVVITPTDGTHATNKSYVDTAISGAASKWTTSGTNTYLTTTTNNVGIGTTTPSAKLEVYSGAAKFWHGGTSEYSIFGSGNELNHFDSANVGKTFYIQYSSNASTNIGKSALFVQGNNGNVGIGTAGPSYKLDVSGTGRFTGTVSVGTPTASNHATTKSYVDDAITVAASKWTTSGTNTYLTTTTNNVGIGTTTPGSKLSLYNSGDTVLSISGNGDSAWISRFANRLHIASNDMIQFGTGGQTDVDMTINNSGNVGIGTVPVAKLNISEATGTVYGSNQGSIIIDHENSGGASSIVFRSKVNRGSDYGYIQYQDDSTIGGTGETARLIIGTANDTVDHIILQPSGSVGIGNTSPSYKLDVSGTGRFTSTVSVGTPTASNHATTKSYVDDAITGAASKWTTSGTNTYLTTTTNNVGIGTNSPKVSLQVNGMILGTTLSTHWLPSIDHNILYNANVRYSVTQSGPASFVLASLFDGVFVPTYTSSAPSDANPQIITISGLPSTHTQTVAYVGWTTRYWGPTRFKIEAYDASSVWQTIADYSGTSYTGGQEFFTKIPNTGAYSQLRFTVYSCSGTSGACGLSEIFFIHSEVGRPYVGLIPSSMWEGVSGNVGIGTTSPSYKLDVSGTGRFTSTVSVGTPTASNHATPKSYVDDIFVSDLDLSGDLNMGTNKLTVGTIDPLFSINGKSYATYAPSMTGVKEESTGVISIDESECRKESNNILCEHEIKFDEEQDGSGLWIFRNVTDFGNNWKNLEIILTPGFNGDVWYKKYPNENKIVISASIKDSNSSDIEVSYRFTAARFDYKDWSNTPTNVKPGAGFKVK
ncbi:MAG: hypothetical protein PHO36_15830 [Parabacteroides sp.]|nr:hypothetical protein [Parabacteroides sp.]